MRTPARLAALSLVATVLAFWLIGFPGICGFTGLYGDTLAATSVGFWIALALFTLPVLVLLASLLWLLIATIHRLFSASKATTPVDPTPKTP